MTSVTTIFIPITIVLFVITIFLALIYLIPILLIRRFHNIHNTFTVNLVFAAICCAVYWLSYFILSHFFPSIYTNPTSCFITKYFSMMCTIQPPLAVVQVSIHRLCFIVYHTKGFFKRKHWTIICISCQWTAGIILSLPELLTNNMTCKQPLWMEIYRFLMIVIIPSFICFTINFIIFNYVRSSTNRVQTISRITKHNQHQLNHRRDLYLLRHMIIMFCIFVGGWSPAYLYPLITDNYNSIITLSFTMLALVCLLFDVIDLFFYNHELRRYLKGKILKDET